MPFKVKEIVDGIIETIREEVDGWKSVCLPPPIPGESQIDYGYLVHKGWLGGDAAIIPYVLAQVAHRGRGEIGLDSHGNILFHFIPLRVDQQAHIGLITAEEIWVVLKAPKAFLDPYHED